MQFKIQWSYSRGRITFYSERGQEIGSIAVEWEIGWPRCSDIDRAWHDLLFSGRYYRDLPNVLVKALDTQQIQYKRVEAKDGECRWRFLTWDIDPSPQDWYLTDQENPYVPIRAGDPGVKLRVVS